MHSDNSPLTAEERQNYVTITAEQSDSVSHRSLFSLSENEVAQQGNESVHSLSYSVPDTGIVQIEIPILATARSLQMKVLFDF